MAEFSVSGESIEDVNELSEQLHRGERLAQSELSQAFKKLIEVKDAVKQISSGENDASRSQIKKQTGYDDVSNALQVLKNHGTVKSRGQGGNWEYVGN
jgi:hypothetical protein